ncbi:hypothetical protein PV392_04055 [Streptomyces sp. ME03-5709C]|nr:hypothetical protein [Streptomyces sp. ME03-5709C]
MTSSMAAVTDIHPEIAWIMPSAQPARRPSVPPRAAPTQLTTYG